MLNDMGEDSETEPEAEGLGQAFEEGIPNLARLRLAVNYNQKQVSWAYSLPSPPWPLVLPPLRHIPLQPYAMTVYPRDFLRLGF